MRTDTEPSSQTLCRVRDFGKFITHGRLLLNPFLQSSGNPVKEGVEGVSERERMEDAKECGALNQYDQYT
ncbi:hypothetical protein STEG23_016611, partial [Scotinomys teguina]